MTQLPDDLISAARAQRLVVFVGAGVSAIAPSCLPGWNTLAALIGQELLRRATDLSIEIAGRPEFGAQDAAILDRIAGAPPLPPDYRAQILHEIAGLRYFQALGCLDVGAVNDAHALLAMLVAASRIGGLITTNFDRLIERAAADAGTPLDVVFQDRDFAGFAPRPGLCPLLKLHGCASAPDSMIDTLKQRKLGRARHVSQAIARFDAPYLLFLGFSADDLTHDPAYLGLNRLAERASGALYVAWPGAPALSEGAETLLSFFGDKARVLTAEVPKVLGDLGAALGLNGTAASPPATTGRAEFDAKLSDWADTLSLPAAGLCLSAVFEAAGHGERAARILDRMVRKLLRGNQTTDPDWLAAEFHYGRMGAALGRFTNVPDLNGMASNASVESLQAMLRAADLGGGVSMSIHLGPAFLWPGMVADALQEADRAAAYLLNSFLEFDRDETGFVLRATPALQDRARLRLSPEQAVEYWIAAAQVTALLQDDTFPLIRAMGPPVIPLAQQAGDPVRAARAAAFLDLLAAVDVTAANPAHRDVLAEAARIGDIAHRGISRLAEGRFLVGPGGRRMVEDGTLREPQLLTRQRAALEAAMADLQAAGLTGWALFARIQWFKALADQHEFDTLQSAHATMLTEAERMPVLLPELRVTLGQILLQTGQPEAARDQFQQALDAAAEMEFPDHNIAILRQYLA